MYRRCDAKWLKHRDFFIIDMVVLLASCLLIVPVSLKEQGPDSGRLLLNCILILLPLNSSAAYFDQTYRGILRRNWWQEALSCVLHIFCIVFPIVLFLGINHPSLEFLNVIVGISLGAGAMIWLLRTAWKWQLLHGSRKNSNQLLLYTSSKNVETVLQGLRGANACIAGLCLYDQAAAGGQIQGIPVVATVNQLPDYMKEHIVDGLLLIPEEGDLIPADLMKLCRDMGIPTHQYLGSLEKKDCRRLVENMGDFTVLTEAISFASPLELFAKRFLDICAGLVGILVTAISFLLVAPAIYLKSPGPIFFTQTRVGRNGRTFKIYKFRSMYMDAEERKKELMAQNKIADGMMFKMDDDPRIIKGIGHFIRDYSIDELPQLWNVLKGEMSLVGTRPPTVDEVKKYQYHHKVRLAAKPGITGMWQVSGRSNITDFEEVVKLDSSYIENWSLLLDFKILLKTVKVVLHKDGAS